MIQFRAPGGTSVPIRLAASPLWECLISLEAARDPARQALHAGWARRAALEGNRLPHVRALLESGTGFIPDFLAPPPASPGCGFAEEIERVLATPASVVQSDLRRAAGGPRGNAARALLERHSGRERELLETIVAELRDYWGRAIQPEWPRLEAIIEAEVLARSHRLAALGPAGALAALHPTVRWTARGVEVDQPGRDDVLDLDQEGLLLVPSVFGWPDVYTVTEAPWRRAVYYPARGVDRWSDDLGDGSDPLAALVGRTRAAIIRQLDRPVSTLELAARLGLAPSAVSRQLTELARTGLIERARIGRRVFYRTGSALRSLVASLPIAPPARR